MPLDPYHLTPNASINRVKLMSAPGLPQAWKGKTAYQVIGRETLVQRISEAFPELSSQADPIPVFSEQYLAQKVPAAEAIADEMGLALGCLLLILKQGEAANREARPEWDDSYWAQWGSIQHIILGGGIMTSLLGSYMLAKASEMLKGLMALTIADYPAALPLIGAARMATELTNSAWVFDFGGTSVKRGHASYANGKLMTLEQLPSILMPVSHEANNLFNFMVEVIVSTVSKQTDRYTALSVNASIANYVQQCHLASDTSYGRLQVLGEDFCHILSEAVSAKVGTHINLALVHDGTAAAKVYAGAVDTAVITIGTALGMGFPPPNHDLHQLSKAFTIQAR